MPDSPEVRTIITTDRDFSRSTLLLPGERVKTKEEKLLITPIIKYMGQFVGQYGGASSLPVTTNAVHMIADLDAFNSGTGENASDIYGGQYFPLEQNVVVYPYSDLHHEFGILQKALYISHELLHLYSFQSFQAAGGDSNNRRLGLQVKDNDPSIQDGFQRLNEAMTEELNKRFDNQYLFLLNP